MSCEEPARLVTIVPHTRSQYPTPVRVHPPCFASSSNFLVSDGLEFHGYSASSHVVIALIPYFAHMVNISSSSAIVLLVAIIHTSGFRLPRIFSASLAAEIFTPVSGYPFPTISAASFPSIAGFISNAATSSPPFSIP